jgi:hypothetical protein
VLIAIVFSPGIVFVSGFAMAVGGRSIRSGLSAAAWTLASGAQHPA